MTEFIQIQPVEITKEISKIKIDVPLIMLNTRCYVKVLCYDVNDKLIHTFDFILEKPDYNIWLRDEDLIDYVLPEIQFSNYLSIYFSRHIL